MEIAREISADERTEKGSGRDAIFINAAALWLNVKRRRGAHSAEFAQPIWRVPVSIRFSEQVNGMTNRCFLERCSSCTHYNTRTSRLLIHAITLSRPK